MPTYVPMQMMPVGLPMQHVQPGNMYGSVKLDNPDDESSSSSTSDATTSVAAKTEEKAEASAPASAPAPAKVKAEASAPVPAPVPTDDASDDSSEQEVRRVRRKKGKGKPLKKTRKGAANLVQVIRDGIHGADASADRPTGKDVDVHVYTCGFEDFDLTAKTWNQQGLEDGIRSRTSRDFHADIIMDCSDLHKGKRHQHICRGSRSSC